MSCNAGILYKMKGILPQKVLKTLYHCFIQSHLNYCSIIWGLGSKSKIEALFVAQKRAIRALIPGFANYFYNKDTGNKPHHTKKTFCDNEIMTVHNLVLLNLLIFMHKVHKEVAPNSIAQLFTKSSELSRDTITDETREIFQPSFSRLEMYNNSLFHKGPKLYNEITHFLTTSNDETSINKNDNLPSIQNLFIKPFKRYVKQYLLEIQHDDDENEWSINNFRLYDGTRSSSRIASQKNFPIYNYDNH